MNMNKMLIKLALRFANLLLETPLLEMASERKYQISKIQSMSNNLNMYLFKYYNEPNHIDRHKWFSEIELILCYISEYNWNYDRQYKFEEYYKWLFTDIKIDDVIFKNSCDIFYKKVCFNLSNKDYDPDLSEIIRIFDVM